MHVVVSALLGHGNAINQVMFHPVDPGLLLSCSRDESLRLWNSLTGLCIAVFGGHQGHRDEVLSMVRPFAIAQAVVSTDAAQPAAPRHVWFVQDIHALGNCIASCGMDNTIKIWSLEDESLQQSIADSYTYGRDATSAARGVFKTVFVQFPMFSTHKVQHRTFHRTCPPSVRY
jgi:polycomb protein EED